MRMELGLSQQQTIKQIQTLSPQMYMSMEILCLNALDLEERIESELENNETLELAEPEPAVEEEVEGGPPAAAKSAEARKDEEAFDQRFESWEEYAEEDYVPKSRSPRSYEGEKDEKLEALTNTAGRPMSLQEHLEFQLHLLDSDEIARLAGYAPKAAPRRGAPAARPGPGGEPAAGAPAPGPSASAEELPVLTPQEEAEIRELCVEVIYNIDNRGYLMYSLEEIAAAMEAKPRVELLERALRVVQGLDPPGVGGRDLKECLLLQLRRDPQRYPVEEKVIANHLEDLAHNRLPKIAKALGVTLEEVKAAAETIASLNPIPGKLFGGEAPQYVKPDVIVEEADGEYVIRVDSGYLPRLQVNRQYRDLYKSARGDKDLKKYLKKKLDGAEWLIAAVRQRQSTLLKIAEEIVSIQRGFLEHGVSHLKPLKMVEVAERVGVHVSTISRAISGKYVQTPRGVFPLKFFFTGGATRTDGTLESRESVIQRIKDLVANEDKANPLSDIDIAKKLAESNIHISRRTVTKYREAEGIPSSRERKSY